MSALGSNSAAKSTQTEGLLTALSGSPGGNRLLPVLPPKLPFSNSLTRPSGVACDATTTVEPSSAAAYALLRKDLTRGRADTARLDEYGGVSWPFTR
jgi:hypothetical protein